jgi:hypothetical protein
MSYVKQITRSLVRLDIIQSLAVQYGKSKKREKSETLDFLCKSYGLKRDTCSKLLRRAMSETLTPKTYLRGSHPQYCHICVQHLKKLWELTDKMGPEKMKAAMPIWLPHYAREFNLAKDIYDKLTKISARTIGRLLQPHKLALEKKNQCKTKSAYGKFKYKIPIKAFGTKIKTPGFTEADTVAHCGTSMLGPHHWTLTLTDIHTTWTENEIMPQKTALETKKAVALIQARLPFRITNFHSDCGTEFLNDEIMSYLNNPKEYVIQTRGRAYKKNDQAHVEQKNHSHVRELLGYYRYDTDDEFVLIQDIYQNEHRLLMNLFTPQRKLQEKIKIGSRYIRKYGPMMTPYQRVMDSTTVSQTTKDQLRELFESLNPLELRRSLNNKINKLMNLKNRTEGKKAA